MELNKAVLELKSGKISLAEYDKRVDSLVKNRPLTEREIVIQNGRF